MRPLGSDIEAGATVLAAGERVGAAEIGILATVGAAHVQAGLHSTLCCFAVDCLQVCTCGARAVRHGTGFWPQPRCTCCRRL